MLLLLCVCARVCVVAPQADPTHRSNRRIHEDDLARLVLHAAGGGPRLLNGVAPAATTAQGFTDTLKRALGRPTWFPPVNVPSFVCRALFGGSDRADFLLRGMRVVPAAALASGFEFEFATIEAAITDLMKKDS